MMGVKVSFASVALFALVSLSGPSMAQQPSDKDADTIKLEATIRGNKEQPKVLSIVPWQLPEHRGIEHTNILRQTQSKFEVLERGQFLRQLRLLSNAQSKTEKLSKAQ